uniref:Uncharacterized protein n=1 Tax=Rhizophora mucronata TaxID=61149 RepID=A0A2P2PAM2_RHIMU
MPCDLLNFFYCITAPPFFIFTYLFIIAFYNSSILKCKYL